MIRVSCIINVCKISEIIKEMFVTIFMIYFRRKTLVQVHQKQTPGTRWVCNANSYQHVVLLVNTWVMCASYVPNLSPNVPNVSPYSGSLFDWHDGSISDVYCSSSCDKTRSRWETDNISSEEFWTMDFLHQLNTMITLLILTAIIDEDVLRYREVKKKGNNWTENCLPQHCDPIFSVAGVKNFAW